MVDIKMVNIRHHAQPCVVIDGQFKHVGFLYMKNERVIVLLNNIVEKADLGPLQSIRNVHIEPEADILILPRGQIEMIKIVESWNQSIELEPGE